MTVSPCREHSISLHSLASRYTNTIAKLAIDCRSTLLHARVMLIKETRLLNLRLIYASHGGTQKAFAKAIGTSANTLNQMFTATRNVGERTARRIEKLKNLTHGWMDQPHPADWERMQQMSYDERIPRALSRFGASLAARIEAITDEHAIEAIEQVVTMAEKLESRQRNPLGHSDPLLGKPPKTD